MEFEDLKERYMERLRTNPRAYEQVSEILAEVKETQQADFLKENPDGDAGQSWRSWKGKNFEKLVHFAVSDLIERELPLKTVRGSMLGNNRLKGNLSRVKRNILVDFGDHGCFVPDADIVVYDPSDYSVKAILSCKVTLRERIAQTGYWKVKLAEDPVTRHIKVFFVTPDEDGVLYKDSRKKPKAIALYELDMTYVLKQDADEHMNIRYFHRIIDDLRSSS